MRPSPRVAALALVAVVVTTACGGVSPDVAATIDGGAVPVEALANLVAGQDVAAGPEGRDETLRSQRAVLSLLVQARVIEAAARERGVEVTEADIEASLREQATALGGREQLRARLSRFGLDEEQARELIFTVLALETKLRESVVGEEPTEEALREAYRQRRDELAQVELRRILVDSQSEALEIRARLDGGADFAQLAREESTDPATASQGGALGTLLMSELPPVVQRAVDGARAGQIVGPVELGETWNVLQVVDLDEDPPFEAVRGLLADQLRQESFRAYEEFIGGVFAEADIRINRRFGRWDPATRQVQPAEPLVGATRGPLGDADPQVRMPGAPPDPTPRPAPAPTPPPSG